MSGPKTSRYTLTPEQRRILAEQRRIERRKAVASENIKRNNKRLLQIGNMFSTEKQVSIEILNRTGDNGGFTKKIDEIEYIITQIAPVVSKINMDDVDSLESTAKKVSESLTQAENIVTELSTIATQNEQNLRTNLNDAIDQGFSTSFAEIKNSVIGSLDESRDVIRAQLLEMKSNSVLSPELKTALQNVINGLNSIHDKQFLKNYSSLTVLPLFKRCKQYLDEYENCHEEFESLYAEYIALCNLQYYVPQEYTCSIDSIEKLKSEIQRIEASAAENDEQAYISECLDEVMEEMGYSVLGSREVLKKNGKHFRNELYTYGEGTAVNVTYSSDGKIAMELGGIDATDRFPDEQEASSLCDSMEQFCTDFREIEKRLLTKGIILADRISLLPPSTEYAQIINTSDYEMSVKVESLHVRKRQKAVTKQKTMRKE